MFTNVENKNSGGISEVCGRFHWKNYSILCNF